LLAVEKFLSPVQLGQFAFQRGSFFVGHRVRQATLNPRLGSRQRMRALGDVVVHGQTDALTFSLRQQEIS